MRELQPSILVKEWNSAGKEPRGPRGVKHKLILLLRVRAEKMRDSLTQIWGIAS